MLQLTTLSSSWLFIICKFIGKPAQAKEDIMSFNTTSSPRQGNSLVITQKGNLILNATRRNPKADEQGQNVTLPMDQLFEYAYLKPNGAVVIKQIGQEEFTFYPAEKKVEAQQPELDLASASVA